MSSDPLFSAHWHHVSSVCPRLADDVIVTHHVYRNRPCHVLQRRSTNVFHRLDTISFELVQHLDGQLSVGELWEYSLQKHDADAPTQDQLARLLAELHAAELLSIDKRLPTEQLFERREKRRERKQHERFSNPLYLRFSLHDPDSWLTRCVPLSRAVFSRVAFYLWVSLISIAVLCLLAHARELLIAINNPELLSPRSALLFVLLYVPLKLLHELGHALAIKRAGGAVRETGIALMVLVPLPYVDASAAAAFPDKADRMLVSAAGILVELGCAAIGALLWVTGTGLVAELGLVLLLSGSVSTLLLNGNPLLRFDGYYLLADWLEIPNLSTRARLAVFGAMRNILLGKKTDPPGVEDKRERIWLLGYGVVSSVYRTALLLWIAWWISGQYMAFGLVLAAFAVYSSLLIPIARGVTSLRRDHTFHAMRPLALLTLVPALFCAIALWLPLPHASVTQGVVWLPEEAIVRTTTGCEISEAPVPPGRDVHKGDVLFNCVDPELALIERELQARLDELDARTGALAVTDPLEYERLKPERLATMAALNDTRERMKAGLHLASLDGRFDVSGVSALEGRALARGEIAGYVVPPKRRTVRVALSERAAGLLDEQPAHIQIRVQMGDGKHEVIPAVVLRRTPRATRNVPSAALSKAGGGEHAIDPAGDGRQLLKPVVDIEIAWPKGLAAAPVGEHVGVRFEHAPTPLANRLLNGLRRAFDSRSRV